MVFVAAFLLVIVTIYWLILVVMFLFQRKLLYHPEYGPINPMILGLENTTKHFVSPKKQPIITLLYHPASKDMPTIVYFHGNSGSLASDYRVERLKAFIAHGFGFAAISYRGFGDSGGTISEQGLYADARATIAFIKRKFKLRYEDMLLFGESLGSGVAVQMATEHRVRGIVLDSPYCSIAKRAQEKYPWLPVELLLKDKFASIDKIKHIHCPMLVIHGDKDDVMPIHHGKALFDAALQPKKGLFIEGLEHVAYPADDTCEAISTYFISELGV